MKDTRTQILNVSTELFLHKSFKEVTMKELVEKTGLSKGAFYHYFESKEQLFTEVVDHLLSTLIEGQYSQMNKDSLNAFYHDYVHFFVESLQKNNVGERANYFSLLFDALKISPELKTKIIKLQQISLSHWVEVIRKSKETGEIKSTMDDEQIAEVFLFSSDGIGLNHIFKLATSEETKKQILTLWGNFYKQLKT